MGTSKHAGFTIIETMLFLAITGMLIAGLLVGVGTSLNIQRYHDSVTSLQSFIQSQYSAINNVQNDRDNSWQCDASATTSQSGSSQNLGQSDCVVLGRYIVINGGSTSVTTVNGYTASTATGNGDIADLKNNYTLGLSTVNVQTDSLAWGTVIAWPVSGSGFKLPSTPRSIAILIVRSPESGSVYTFTADNPPAIGDVTDVNKMLKSMLVTGVGPVPSQLQRTICVDSQGLVSASLTMAVYLHAYATDQTSVETRSNDVIKSLGGDTQC
jgi:type II secretory pathway pseudopilin PulG